MGLRVAALVAGLIGLQIAAAFLQGSPRSQNLRSAHSIFQHQLTSTAELFMLKDPTYFVVSPRIVRAGHTYRLVVNVLPPSPDLVVIATLLKDNIHVDAVEKTCQNQSPTLFEIQVPSSLNSGKYTLKLEGNEVGWLTGSAFRNETELVFSPRGATVFIQLEKKIYAQADQVRMRIIALGGSMSLVNDALDVFVLSPRGVLVKRWLSRQSGEGTISLEFDLSPESELGEWKVRVEATDAFAEEVFLVEQFEQPLFQVQVDIPAFISSSHSHLEGIVSANYTSGAPVVGNITVLADVKLLSKQSPTYYKTTFTMYQMFDFGGYYRFRFPMDNLRPFFSGSSELEMKISATVGDALLQTVHSGFSTVRIFGRRIRLNFLGESPFIINPSMAFQYHLVASMGDGSAVPKERLTHYRLKVTPEIRLRSGEIRRTFPRNLEMDYGQYCLWTSMIDLTAERNVTNGQLEDIEHVTLKAELKDASGDRTYARLIAVPRHTTSGKSLQLSTSTNSPKVDEYVVLHVRSNFYLEKFRYVVISKGILIKAGQESMDASLRTFPLAITPEMSGTCTVIVYSIARDQEVVADAISFPVDALVGLPLAIQIEKRPTQGSVKITVQGEPNSVVSLSGTHLDLFQMQKESFLSKEKMVEEIMKDCRMVLEPRLSYARWESQDPLVHRWASEKGHARVVRKVWSYFGTDTSDVFGSSGLGILSDGGVPARPRPCKESQGLNSCLLGGCYTTASACDLKYDCPDRIDERGCPKKVKSILENLSEFRLSRQSRLSRHFDPSWLWKELVLDANGRGSLFVMIPDRPSDLVVSAFTVQPNSGKFTLLDNPVSINLNPPFWVWIEAPSHASLWEQVGVRVTFVNKMKRRLPATVTLADSHLYRYVNVERFALTFPDKLSGENRRRVRWVLGGEQKHSVVVPGLQARTIYLPIVPVAAGPLVLAFEIEVPGSKIRKSAEIHVQPVGVFQEKHTSSMLDLRNRQYFFIHLCAFGLPCQSSVSSRAQTDRMGGVTQLDVSLFGGVVGGVESDIITPRIALNLPSMGSEPIVFSMMMSVMQLDYWQKLDQVPAKDERRVLERVTLLYQDLLAYQNADGGFKYFKSSKMSSVWVTCLVVRVLGELSVNWQRYLYVDPQVNDRSIRFLLAHQSNSGAFWEPSGNAGMRNFESHSNSPFFEDIAANNLNLTVTALAIIQLLSLRELPEPLDTEVEAAISKGQTWLEINLDTLGNATRPLELSLSALALHLTQSDAADAAFELLVRNARHNVNFIYWSEDVVSPPSSTLDGTRPNLLPRDPHKHDSGSVAATAAALRVYTLRCERLTLNIVRWLHSQRKHSHGWASTLDSMFAWEALYKYDLKNNVNRHAYLSMDVKAVKNFSLPYFFHVRPANVLHLQTYKIHDFVGSVRVQGKGNGTAVLHASAKYYVSEPKDIQPPPVKSFSLDTSVTAYGDYSSSLSFTSCVKWVNFDFSPTSDIAVLEVSLPTGYGITLHSLNKLVTSKSVPNLKKAEFLTKKVAFYFEKIGPKKLCVQFSVNRWFPVANLSKVLEAKVYEYYSPELYQTEMIDVSSFTMDICDVCGSYQCPNCPVLSYFTSAAASVRPRPRSLLALIEASPFIALVIYYYLFR